MFGINSRRAAEIRYGKEESPRFPFDRDLIMELEDSHIPVPGPVAGACEMLGLDPLYVANEGVLMAAVAADAAEEALAILRSHPVASEAALIGRVVESHPGMVVLKTGVGGTRVVDTLPGDQLPRIC